MSRKSLWPRALALATALALPGLARADFKVWTPDVQPGELAIETVGDLGHDRQPAHNGEQSDTIEVETGLTSWWQSELEIEFNRAPGPAQGTNFNQFTWENLFEFTERGESFVDLGWFAEYGQGRRPGNPNEVTTGPVLRKDIGGTSNSLNVFVSRDWGPYGSGQNALLLAFESRVDAWTWRSGQRFSVEPGLQFYGQPGTLKHLSWSGGDERAGPQLFGKVFDIGPGTLEWNGGVLFGLSPAAPRLTLRWQLEYEIHY
jgi:hypothetical protein